MQHKLLLGVASLVFCTYAHTEAEIQYKKANKIAIFYNPQFLLHDTGAQHPERAERLIGVIEHLKHHFAQSLIWPSFQPASKEALALIHTPQYLQLVENEISALGKNQRVQLSTGDTTISPSTLAVAKLAAGAAIAASDAVMAEQVNGAFALTRPPGHHASAARGMGFCVYNNVAIAARHLQQQYGLKRILIVDFDVHHGNGTQDIFYADNSVFYFSIHQSPLYPGTGRATETGVGKGLGYTLNVELPAGAGDDALMKAIETQLKPAMQKFKPEFILVSAGFDSHRNDPLGNLQYTDQGYANVAKALTAIAQQNGHRRVVYLLEGGYNPANITSAVSRMLNTMLETP